LRWIGEQRLKEPQPIRFRWDRRALVEETFANGGDGIARKKLRKPCQSLKWIEQLRLKNPLPVVVME
jgi:hypothetical protein